MPKGIRKLEKSNFMTLLHMQVNKDLSESERERLNTVYDRFINQIQHVSKQENQSKLDSLHVLARIRERLARLLESCCDRKSMQYALIKSALSLIEFEKKLIYLQLKYPGVRDAQSKRRHSPLKISKKYTNSDLMELIAPLSPDSSAFTTTLRHRSCKSSGNSKSCAIPESKIPTTAVGPF